MDHATSIILSLQVAPPLGGAPRLRQRSHTYPRVSIYQPILSASLSLFEYSLRSLIFLYTVPPMLSSLFVRLRTVFLCCTFTYYLPAKCTFHSQDPLSTLPPLFSLSSFSPVSSRFTETSVPPANKINASISCIFAFDENVETRGLLALRVLSISPSFLLSRLCDRAPKPMAAREEIFKTTALVSLDTIRSTIYGVPFDKTKPFVYVHIPFTNSTRTIEPSDSLYRIVQKSTVHGYRK